MYIGIMKQITLSEWARRNKVSRQKAHEWMVDGRIASDHPCPGVVLIDENEPRPKKLKPWERVKDKLY